MGKLDGTRLSTIGLGDELGDRDSEFKRWSQVAFRQACVEANLDIGYEPSKRPHRGKLITKLIPLSKDRQNEFLEMPDQLISGEK